MDLDNSQTLIIDNTVQLFNSFSDPSTENTATQTTYFHDVTNNFLIFTYSSQGREATVATERRSIKLRPHFQSTGPPQ